MEIFEDKAGTATQSKDEPLPMGSVDQDHAGVNEYPLRPCWEWPAQPQQTNNLVDIADALSHSHASSSSSLPTAASAAMAAITHHGTGRYSSHVGAPSSTSTAGSTGSTGSCCSVNTSPNFAGK